jgi:HNH endonuclease
MACSESHGRGTGGRRGIPGYERVTQRGELLASKDARVVYAGFLVLDRADQHAFADALLRELTSRQPRDTPSRRMTEAIRSLREATHTLGEPPTIRQFETLRREHPEWGWPPSSTIRRWLGARAWDEALRLAGLPTPLPGDALEPELGPAFTTREAIEALQQCTQDLGRLPSFNEYHAWAHRSDVIGRPGRRPLSEGPFCRLFGSFQLAIVAAGLAEDARSAVVAGNGNVRAAYYRVSDEQITEALKEVAARLGHAPNTSEYTYMRKLLYEESRAQGRPRILPSYQTINRRFGRWDKALTAAGLGTKNHTDET